MPNPRETATVIIDRSKLNLPPPPQAPAAPVPAVPQPARDGSGKWPIVIAALVVLLAAVIAWYVLSSA
jgi:hypothetical protein